MSTALITGASSGIGEVFARRLSALGHDLILVARRTDRLEQLAASLPSRRQTITADLTTDEGLQKTERAIAAAPDLDLLINNAGFGTLGRFWETEPEGQLDMHRLHVTATLRLTRAALRGMVPRQRGSIVNVSSVAAFSQSAGNVSYCATKAWMNSFTEGIAMELRGIGSPVRVQALCPGFTRTEFHDTLGVDPGNIPAMLWMSADDVVEASLRGLARGRTLVVPGWQYKMAVGLLRHVPARLRPYLRRPGRDKRV